MEGPIRPLLSDFGLTESEVASLPNAAKKTEMVGYFAGALVFVFIVLQTNSSTDFTPLLIGGIFGALIAIAFVNYFLSSWMDKHLLETNEKFRRYREFLGASYRYEAEKKKYEIWRRRSEEGYWRSLTGIEFERELAAMYEAMGYLVSMTPSTGDGGVDLLLKKDKKLTIVQCKAHTKKISIGVARELVASMFDFQADDAIIACFEGATKPVRDYIAGKRISVLTVSDIVEMQRNLRRVEDSLAIRAHAQPPIQKAQTNTTSSLRHWSEKINRED